MEPEEVLNRAYAHWFEDGILEFEMGVLLAGVGTLRAIIHFAQQNSATYYWLSACLFLFMILVAGVGSKFSKALKARITYPRTGFMAFKHRALYFKNVIGLIALLILGGIIGVAVGVLASQPNQEEIGGIVPITQGIVGAILFAYAGHRTSLDRFYYLAPVSLGIGLLIGSLGIGVVLGLSYFYLCIGLTMLVSGSVALARLIRDHEPVNLEGESG